MFKPNVEHTETDYGFLLIHEGEDEYVIEVYGMVGIGHFELAASCGYGKDEDLDEILGGLLGLEACIDSMLLYIETKKALKGVFTEPA